MAQTLLRLPGDARETPSRHPALSLHAPTQPVHALPASTLVLACFCLSRMLLGLHLRRKLLATRALGASFLPSLVPLSCCFSCASPLSHNNTGCNGTQPPPLPRPPLALSAFLISAFLKASTMHVGDATGRRRRQKVAPSASTIHVGDATGRYLLHCATIIQRPKRERESVCVCVRERE